MSAPTDLFSSRSTLSTRGGDVAIYRLDALAKQGLADLTRLPMTVKIILENLLRRVDGRVVTGEDVETTARWNPAAPAASELPYLPSRVLMQDFTGVPAVVDLAAMRAAVARMGGDPTRINPLAPVDLVIDHSVQVDAFGNAGAFNVNVKREYERNTERYLLLRWAQSAFKNFRVVPPGTGIVHQVNLEYLASVVGTSEELGGGRVAYPDTLVGTDSHTVMVSGLGCLGWGVGGIEAEAVLLGQPLYLLTPQVVGFRLRGQLPEGTTATDLVLTITELLREHGVVEKFVEFTGDGLSSLSLADRATLSNMSPEYGATTALFPVDNETLRYLHQTGRSEDQVDLVERYCKEQGLFRVDGAPEPKFSEMLDLDLGSVTPCLAGPRRPQDRVPLGQMKSAFRLAFQNELPGSVSAALGNHVPIELDGEKAEIGDGSVVIAAITSCTNTSNPAVMIGAGLLARKAVERGLDTKPWVKTSLAPGSQVVTEYLNAAGVTPFLDQLRFNLVGYGCTTCIGNSGPLLEPVGKAIDDENLIVAAVLSGNRNFEGRIHAQVRAAYLASPPLVVAFALAGRVDIDLTVEPLGTDKAGQPVFLRDIWPSTAEVQETLQRVVTREMFEETYASVFSGGSEWATLPVPQGALYAWDPDSTYVQEPPFFEDLGPEPQPLTDITGARALLVLGDSITTDHISPAGAIEKNQPAGQYLMAHGVEPGDFNSLGARRGNHQVMMRATFANIRLRNALTPDKEGDWSIHLPSGTVDRLFNVSQRYIKEGTPLVVFGGREYGSGSSRDWAAKGPLLLGIKAVIAESYERIHRSNLVGMGILPLQFLTGDTRMSLGLTGRETFDIQGIAEGLTPHKELTVVAHKEDGSQVTFKARARVDSVVDVEYIRHGGVLQMVFRNLVAS